MAPTTVSALGMALNGKSASVDIPKPRDAIMGRDNFTAAPASSKKHSGMLPTPPNSISPNLPPHGRRDSRHHGQMSPKSTTVDSDIDLRDAGDDPQLTTLSAEALDSLGDLDSAGAITPNMLAKHHLPDILLSHGPLAIRHIMGYLTTTVPGFSRITSAKARRLVVAALEGKGGNIERDGEVIFDKVGWGRWDARIKGQPPRERQGTAMTPPGSLPSSYSQPGLQVTGQRSWRTGSQDLGTSYTGNSAVFSHSEMEYEDQDMLEHEADKMSLDGDDDDGYVSSIAPEPIDEDLGDGEITDEEDWGSIGAEALRARSLPNNARSVPGPGRLYQPIATYSYQPRQRSKTPADIARTAPTKAVPINQGNPFSFPTGAGLNDSQERAAIEALLSLGSM
ncbi:DNA-binding proteins Bright/BRCAA1/RBP1 and proteins containing BRIGHT domain [Exophiala xenobiotica]|uniref:DNA-binding proteins Bright/BRCAA1/RBP1 and proteins containing BRIGHT domain n=1 Tax=Vermiconidia calcicola TaxID=1690605 RepID=A0AAV9Q8J1_9PEZI|nr:DNA-binding proteins Bright/BRCAA1/RBP1 and proteins containing BRIGHT domain [Exophiala xenobiotica]KAK5530777.1 DNA-binding proteins Bright/BRCAA1/RBP1 and proteins containing BRIGHT domain [Chaetothyriales sp. CCFEE 6169]KAK5538471.1 DNA-binding proteins Bright/BRCAA1/RBP1 and proteins containing BRIGHT domain [Vermiconidia calcicola]KAK5305259.1 DNA-binding proteins Bright/BRCAA1/RBP1 and proteins containing BRIGHT domain [Exophiala xenobiotica]KAK5426437.1 DNA-binding proteins Bright/BR